MLIKGKKMAVWAIVLLLLIVPGILLARTWFQAAAAADYSAHAALTKEIVDQLAAIPSGQPYPSSLSQLRLTFPDGGDTSLLKRFEYRSDGASCTVRTVLGKEEFVRSFP
jgi:hypothetical protein